MPATEDHSDILRSNAPDGSFKRQVSTFRSTIEKGGRFEPERDRYYLYVSYGCPWAHRTLVVRKLKGLEDIIGVIVVSPRMDQDGWPFANVDDFPGTDVDRLNGASHMKDIYLKVEPNYTGRYTVPVLWDDKTSKIVNNESSDIIRILNSAFNDIISPDKARIDLYPEPLRAEIDALNEWVYNDLNNGVYKSGFATSQEAYESAVTKVFDALDRLEGVLGDNEQQQRHHLVGSQLTEADVRLYTTVIRFDVAYHGLFKCNLRTIRSGYPHIHLWLRRLYWTNPAFKDTTNFDHIIQGYYSSKSTNPSRIYPKGPVPLIESLA